MEHPPRLLQQPFLIAAVVLAVALAVMWWTQHPAGSGESPPPQKAPPKAPAPQAKPEEQQWSPPRFSARQQEREAMAQVIAAYGLADRAVLESMRAVPRHEFVPPRLLSSAHADSPLPIGHGQTISQPYIVAEMTRQLQLTRKSKVLEIGTGSGYQAAVLSEFTPHVYSIEIIEALAQDAAARLKRLGYSTVKLRTGDGYEGWKEEAPFDAIIVTCAAGQVPPPLLEQLAPRGRMVIPVGGPFSAQTLVLVEKDKEGALKSRALMGVQFVPFVRKK